MRQSQQEISPENAENELGEAKISKLLLKFSLPCILSLLISALYNIVDQIFIGQGVGYLGNAATTVVYPFTVIALAVSLLICDGSAALLSLSLGRRDAEEAHPAVIITFFPDSSSLEAKNSSNTRMIFSGSSA